LDHFTDSHCGLNTLDRILVHCDNKPRLYKEAEANTNYQLRAVRPMPSIEIHPLDIADLRAFTVGSCRQNRIPFYLALGTRNVFARN
jgi:hypothetical protein